MVNYHYCCKSCAVEFETRQSIKDEPLKKCPACGKKKLERVIGCPSIIIKGEICGLYQLAKKNSVKMGRTQVEEKSFKPEKGERPFWRKGKVNKELANLTPIQTKNYIETGKIGG